MATLAKKAIDEITGKKKKGALHELKDWALSPGGLVTIFGFVLLFLYVRHVTSDEKK